MDFFQKQFEQLHKIGSRHFTAAIEACLGIYQTYGGTFCVR